MIYLTLVAFLACVHASFEGEPFPPLKDDVLFRINWPGDKVADVQTLAPPGMEYSPDDSFLVTSASNEKYKCTVPSITTSDSSNQPVDSGAFKSPHELLASIFKSAICTYNVQTYWTYEVCHGKHVRQYHEERIRRPNSKGSSPLVLKTEDGKEILIQQEDDKNDLIKTTEYFLGYMSNKVDKDGMLINPGQTPNNPEEVTRKKINGVDTPYYAVNLTDGTPCDLKSGSSRRSRILYVCGADSRNDLISVSETSSCEYEVVVLTPSLCKHPFYRSQGQQVNEIQCVALENSPMKPVALTKFLSEQSSDTSRYDRRSGNAEVNDEPTKNEFRRVEETKISSRVDKSLLKEFLSGTYCLRGGTGWWRFEYCFGEHVNQYHDDKKSGRTTIRVGTWNKADHIEWTKRKSSKPVMTKVNEKGEREISQISHYYKNGDVCKETGKKREVVVQMKCKKDSKSAHSVTLYMLEPSTCSYILGIESLIFCDLLNSADEYGLVDIDL